MLDAVQIIFWSMAYLLIIIAGVLGCREKTASMPYTAGVMIFSWEICAMIISRGFWGHLLWLLLDVGIVLINLRCIRLWKNKILYAASILACTGLIKVIFSLPDGMLYSSFIIDFIMAVYFLVDRKRLSGRLKIPIAFIKMLGDTCAGLYYGPDSELVGVVSILVFFINSAYLYLCIEEIGEAHSRKEAAVSLLL